MVFNETFEPAILIYKINTYTNRNTSLQTEIYEYVIYPYFLIEF